MEPGKKSHRQLTSALLKKSVALITWIVVVASAQPAHAQSLTFFKNYFVTGDYATAGVGLDKTGAGGRVSGTINISDASVPEGAEALAAFLYWQVVSSSGPNAGALTAKFNGQLLSTPTGLPTPAGPLSVVGNPAGTQSCPLTGGSGNRVYAYRSDVLRFLDVVDGRHRIKGAYAIELPDGGGNSQMPRALGASLVVIYRHPDPTWPLNAIVMYDGNYTKQSSQTMTQTIQGYYDATAVAGKITHITGSAQSNLSERLRVPGGYLDNAFRSAQGASWDNLTVETASPGGASFVTSVEPRGLIGDCLTWGAIVYRTQVNDEDSDGLLNAWELSTSVSPLFDPHGEPLPALADMGAQLGRRDVFVEIAYLATTGPLSYGGVSKDEHTHLPTYGALRKAGQAFSAQGIALHVDVGDNYQDAPLTDPVHIIDAAQARGGEGFDETVTTTDGLGGPCVPDPDRPWVCQFNEYPGTVGWKSGFRLIKDMPLFATGAVNPNAPSVEECEAAEQDGLPATVCERVFNANRKDMFRFVLSAHALGIPKKSCLVEEPSSPDFGFPDFNCQDTEPLFHVPVTNTGVGDFLGGDAMMTLGGFNDAQGRPVGTDYMQGATLAHELGHGMGLRHGAFKLPDGTIVPEPNCKPNYLSVMNYLFQLRGLQDDLGVSHVDFSGLTLPPLDEMGLPAVGLNAAVSYRTGWYAPKSNVRFGSAATKHCDGSPLLFGPDGEDAGTDPDSLEPAMVRVDSKTVLETGGAIDWDYTAGQLTNQDANFDGEINHAGGSLHGFNDWESIRLNQVGSRRNVGGWYWVPDPNDASRYFAFMGPLSISVAAGDLGNGDPGKEDLGKGDLGKGDLGKGDLGKGDLGKGDLGKGDLGKGDLGKGDLGKGDLGKGDLGDGDTGEAFELDADIAAGAGFTPPTEVKAFVRGTNGAGGTNSSVPPGSSYDPWVPLGEPTNCTLGAAECHRVRVDWKVSNAGPASSYRIFREVQGSDPVEITAFGYDENIPGEFTLVDKDELPNGVVFTYFVTALFDHDNNPQTDLIESGESNHATITAVNIVPVAITQSVADAWEDIPVNIVLTASDPDTTVLTFIIVTGTSHGGLSGVVPSVTYTPTLNYNMTDGPEGFSFKVRESSTWQNLGEESLPANVNIPVNPVNDAPSFTLKASPNQSVAQPAGAQTVAGLVVGFSPGPANESTQVVAEYIVTNSNNALFSVQPAIAVNGTLTYTPAPGASGTATVSVKVRDNGGVDPPHGGVDTSGIQTFTITITNIVYEFVNIKNLPANSGTTYKPSPNGTMVEFSFKLKKDGKLVDARNVRPRITIKGPAGSPWATAKEYTPGCTTATVIACQSFNFGTSDKLWNLQWKPVNAPVGTYYVIVQIDESGQRFPATGNGFPIVFKK